MQRVVLSGGVVDLVARTYHRIDGGEVRLTPRERDLLGWLAERPGEIVSREELLEQVWNYASTVHSRAVDKTMVGLRTKVEADPAEPVHLLTERGVGYRFVPVSSAAESALPGHEDAVAAVVSALLDGRGPITVVGPPGAGQQEVIRAACAAACVDPATPRISAGPEPRHLAGEQVVRLAPIPRPLAIRLLAEGSGHPAPSGDDPGFDALDRVAAALDDLPGPLRHAATRLHLVPADDLLSREELDAPEWRSEVEALLADLPASASIVAHILAVLHQSTDAVSIAEIAGMRLGRATDALALLEQRSLVRLDPTQHGRVRLLHGVSRVLARTSLVEARSRVARWLAPGVRQAVADTDAREVARGIAWLERYRPELDDLGGPDDPTAGWCLLGAAAVRRIAGTPDPDHLPAAIIRALGREDSALGDAMAIERARTLMVCGRFEEAREAFEEARERTTDAETARIATGGLSWSLRCQVRDEEARAVLANQATPEGSYGSALMVLEAAVLRHRIDLEGCLVDLRAAAQRLESEGWLRLACTARLHSGMVALHLGLVDVARRAWEQAEVLATETVNAHARLLARTNLIDVALRLDRLDHAEAAIRETLPLAEESGTGFTGAVLRLDLAEIHLRRGDYDAAEAEAVACLPLLSEDHPYAIEARQLQAGALAAMGLVGPAAELLEALPDHPLTERVRCIVDAALGKPVELPPLPEDADTALVSLHRVARRICSRPGRPEAPEVPIPRPPHLDTA